MLNEDPNLLHHMRRRIVPAEDLAHALEHVHKLAKSARGKSTLISAFVAQENVIARETCTPITSSLVELNGLILCQRCERRMRRAVIQHGCGVIARCSLYVVCSTEEHACLPCECQIPCV